MTAVAFAKCTVGKCQFQAASDEQASMALAFVDAALRRHMLEAHGHKIVPGAR